MGEERQQDEGRQQLDHKQPPEHGRGEVIHTLLYCVLVRVYPPVSELGSQLGPGLLNSQPKDVLAGRPSESGQKWPKVAERGQKWPKLNRVILKLLNLTNKVYNVTITYNTFIIFILVVQYFPQTPGRLATNTKLFKYSLSDIFIHCTSYSCMSGVTDIQFEGKIFAFKIGFFG